MNRDVKEDLGVWFGTKKKKKGDKQPKGPWVDICRKDKDGKHPPCGRKDADKGAYPKCRAASVAGKMSEDEKKRACRQKRNVENKDKKTGKGQKPNYTSHKKDKKKKTNEGYEILKPRLISEELKYHIDNEIPLHENSFRIHSDAYFGLINEARDLYNKGLLELDEDEQKLVETNIGEKVKTTIGDVYLDCPFVLDEAEYKGKDVDLNQPFRTPGGPKKFAVYVKNPKTDKVKMVRFGDSGLSIKGDDPEAKKSFLARHKCDEKKDRTKPGWWSCNIHLYKKQLGLKFKGKW